MSLFNSNDGVKIKKLETQLLDKASKKKTDVWIDVKNDYGASGSNLTTNGSITANSKTLTLTSVLDFKNGQGIQIYGAGALCTLATPTNVTVAPQGTAGTSTYSYQVVSVSLTGSVSAASSTVTTTTGNATLDTTNYNQIAFTKNSSANCYAFYRTSVPDGSSLGTGFIGYFYDTPFKDFGLPVITNINDWLPASPPVSATREPLITSIVSGEGTSTLTLADNAVGTVTNKKVIHDDTKCFQNAIDFINTNGGGTLLVPSGKYNLTRLTPYSNLYVTGNPNAILYQIDTQRTGIFCNNIFPSSSPYIENFHVEKLTMIGASTAASSGTNYQTAIWIENAKDMSVIDCTIKDFVCGGLHFPNVMNVWVERNKFYNIGTGFTSNGQATWNTVTFTSTVNDPYGVVNTAGCYWVRDNLLDSGNTGGIVVQSFAGNTDRCVISGNIIKNYKNWVGIAVECGWGQKVIITNNQIYECPNFIAVNDTSGTSSSQTQQKISDIIISNNYCESNLMQVNQGIYMQGSKFTITGNTVKSNGQNLYVSSLNGATVPSQYFTVTGNLIIGTGTSPTIPSVLANFINVKTGTISGNTFTNDDNSYAGSVYIQGGRDASNVNISEGLLFTGNTLRRIVQRALNINNVDNATISNNMILDWGNSQTTSRYGIFVQNSNNITINGNTLRDTRSTQYADNGINIHSSCTKVYIENNIIGIINGTPIGSISGLDGTKTIIARNNEGYNPLPFTITPSTPIPVHNTMYQNTNGYDITVYIPVYATTPGTSGSVIAFCNDTSTTKTYYTEFVSSSTTSSAPHVVKIRVPTRWYYGVYVSGVTIGTSTMYSL
jgi:hypothetical protein